MGPPLTSSCRLSAPKVGVSGCGQRARRCVTRLATSRVFRAAFKIFPVPRRLRRASKTWRSAWRVRWRKYLTVSTRWIRNGDLPTSMHRAHVCWAVMRLICFGSVFGMNFRRPLAPSFSSNISAQLSPTQRYILRSFTRRLPFGWT